MDQQLLNRRILRNLLTAPWIFFPGALGLALMALGLAFGAPTGGTVLTGLVFFLLSAAGLGSQYLLRGEQLTHEAIEDLRREKERRHFDRLRQLQRQLRLEREPRTAGFVQQMRELYQRLERACLLGANRTHTLLPEVCEKAEALYRSCFASLERALEMSGVARQLATAEAQQQVRASREKLLDEIETTLRHLGATLDHLQTAQLNRDDHQENLSKMRAELDAGLAVARRVEARVGELERGVRGELTSE